MYDEKSHVLNDATPRLQGHTSQLVVNLQIDVFETTRIQLGFMVGLVSTKSDLAGL